MSRLEQLAQTFLTRRRPGRALTWLARTPVPVMAAEWFARQAPLDDDGVASPSPFVENILPREAPPGILDGGVVIKDCLLYTSDAADEL